MFKTVLIVCAQALFIQSIAGRCIGAGLGVYEMEAPLGAANWAGLATGPFTAGRSCGAAGVPALATSWSALGGYGPSAAAASHGGALPVSSASAIPASGVSVRSDNAIEGALAVSGALPFLGTVALEGALPTAGAGAVAYSCGNGEVAMLSEDIGVAGYNGLAGPLGYRTGALGYANGPLGYNTELVAPAYSRAGCGCGSRLI